MNNVDVDLTKIQHWLSSLDLSKHKEDTRRIMDEATGLVYVQAQRNLHSMLNQTGKNKYGLTLASGISRKVWKNDQGGTVWINQGANYIVYMHGKGTKDRYTKGKNGKKQAFRGKLEAKPFFKNAVDSTESTVIALIQKRIIELMNKLNK